MRQFRPAAERRATLERLRSGPVSRVLSARRPYGLARGTAIFLGRRLPGVSSSLPERRIGTDRPARFVGNAFCGVPTSANVLLGLAPGGVCRASRVTPAAGALLPHRFTLTAGPKDGGSGAPARRSAFCCTFPSLAAGRCYRPPCPVEPGLSSPDAVVGGGRPARSETANQTISL